MQEIVVEPAAVGIQTIKMDIQVIMNP